MPLVEPSGYSPPLGFGNAHVQSIVPAVLRRVPLVTGERERIGTGDGDFLDLDWARGDARGRALAVIAHGLEGDARQPYVQGMARALRRRGWDVLAWNFRGCSGEPNRLPRSYHSGATDDLERVIAHALQLGYAEIGLVGFSLGGNVVAKFLGDAAGGLPAAVRAAACFSVPCDLAAAARHMARPAVRFYMRRFMRRLRTKMRQKIGAFPGEVRDHGLDAMRTFEQFDERYTAPLHGFEGAGDYWQRCSSKPVLGAIRVPCLMVNAADDPFLPPECFPTEAARRSRDFFLEVPPAGGHVGFVARNRAREFWSETRAADFLGDHCEPG